MTNIAKFKERAAELLESWKRISTYGGDIAGQSITLITAYFARLEADGLAFSASHTFGHGWNENVTIIKERPTS